LFVLTLSIHSHSIKMLLKSIAFVIAGLAIAASAAPAEAAPPPGPPRGKNSYLLRS
jgi:hypothetical protein